MERLIIIILLIMLGACGTDNNENTSELQTSTDSNASNWTTIADGLETQIVRKDITFFQALRIDPEQYAFRTHYSPDTPLGLDGWIDALPDAVAIINANYFAVDNTVLGLLISNSQRFGTTYENRGGTFFTTASSIGLISTREAQIPLDVSQAVQAFPMLVIDGNPAYNNAGDTAIARRTVIALDSNGYVIILVTSGFGMSLYDLSQYLASSDLDLVTALNLDGGGSSMLYIAPSDNKILSLDPVPAVLSVYEK